jgi:hypothetical protein
MALSDHRQIGEGDKRGTAPLIITVAAHSVSDGHCRCQEEVSLVDGATHNEELS